MAATGGGATHTNWVGLVGVTVLLAVVGTIIYFVIDGASDRGVVVEKEVAVTMDEVFDPAVTQAAVAAAPAGRSSGGSNLSAEQIARIAAEAAARAAAEIAARVAADTAKAVAEEQAQ